MTQERKSYTREFKIEAVRLLLENEATTQQLATDLGVSASSLNRWRREYLADVEQAFPGHALSSRK